MFFKNIFISKIGNAVLFRVILFSSLITLLLSGLQLYNEFIRDYKQADEIQQQIDNSYLKSLETAVWGINKRQAKALLDGITALPTVKNASILNEDGSLYISHNEDFNEKYLLYSKELLSPLDDYVIATLNVYQSHEDTYKKLKSRLFIVLLANFIKTFLVATFILYVFQQLVARHLRDIFNQLKRDNIFQQHKPITLDRPVNATTEGDELDILTTTFNEQRQALFNSWRELEHSEKKYRELTEGSLQGILIIDYNWEYIYSNKQFLKILKFKDDNKQIFKLDMYFTDEMQQALMQLTSQPDHPPIFKEELKLKTEDLSFVYVQAILKLVHYEDKPTIQIVILDISEQKELKDKQKNIELQLIQKNKMSAIGTMLSGVTHEINNPNHLIRQNALILKETWDAIKPLIDSLENDQDRRFNNLTKDEIKEIIPELIEDINQGSDRINNIVMDLRSFIRQDVNLPIERCSLNEIILKTTHILRTSINKNCNNFKLELENNLPKTWCYQERLSQVFTNLIINALEAIEDPEKLIKIATYSDSEYIYASFLDEGVGILPENKYKIFDAFYSTKIDTGGTGLGLAISQSLTAQHHGELILNDDYHKGTEFIIKFPRGKKPMKTILGIPDTTQKKSEIV